MDTAHCKARKDLPRAVFSCQGRRHDLFKRHHCLNAYLKTEDGNMYQASSETHTKKSERSHNFCHLRYRLLPQDVLAKFPGMAPISSQERGPIMANAAERCSFSNFEYYATASDCTNAAPFA